VWEFSPSPHPPQDAAAHVATRWGLTSRQTARLVDALLGAPGEPERKQVLKAAGAAKASSAGPKGGAQRRTPAEQLAADAFAMKRMSARLHTRLLERPLESLGADAATLAARELLELKAALTALCATLCKRLAEKESFYGRPE
jgi:hypothetical protein